MWTVGKYSLFVLFMTINNAKNTGLTDCAKDSYSKIHVSQNTVGSNKHSVCDLCNIAKCCKPQGVCKGILLLLKRRMWMTLTYMDYKRNINFHQKVMIFRMNIELCLFSEINNNFHIFHLSFLYWINFSCNLPLNLQSILFSECFSLKSLLSCPYSLLSPLSQAVKKTTAA